jgi:uncharacterized protein YabE (DUF348 family)/3D (Asp-Asp-Asp) domain-containing protein
LRGVEARALLERALAGARANSILLDRRRRAHLAAMCAILFVFVFGVLLLEPRKVRVLADGRELTLQTHQSHDGAVLDRAGIDLGPGDRVTSLEGDDADVIRVDRARRVVLHADGIMYEMLTHAVTVEQLLAEVPYVTIGERDSVLKDGVVVPMNAPLEQSPLLASIVPSPAAPDPGSPTAVEVRRAVTFSVDDDGREFISTSSRPTVVQALREAGVSLGPGDVVTPAAEEKLAAGTEISIRRARALTVTLPDDHQVLYTLARTVGDALAEAGIVVPENAFIDPAPDTPIASGMSVRVVELSASSDVEREFIESGTVYRSDPALGPGETRTVRGHDGVLVRRYEVAYVNGEETQRTLVEEYYDPEPQDTVIYYPVQSGRDVGAPPEGGVARTLHVYATWYNAASSGRAPSDPNYGRTATGVIVTYGIVAVDPNVIPLGTKMFIPGYGYGVAADTGGAVKGYIIDLGYPDGVAVDWQSRWLDIYILE